MQPLKIIALFIFFLLLLTGMLSAAALEVAFQPNATVSEATVRLSDIAVISPAGDAANLLGVNSVATAPAAGRTRDLKAVSIISSMRHIPEAENVFWKGSDTITVKREGLHISKDQLQQIIAQYLQQNLDKLPRAEIRFTSIRAPSELILPIGELTWKVTPSKLEIIGSSSFSILFKIDGKAVKNCTVRGKLEALTDVVTATVNLRRGEIILPDQIKMTRLNLAKLENPFQSPELVVGMEVTRTIRAGRVIDKRHVAPPPVIKEGELVKIFAGKGHLRISTIGIAKTGGRSGDTIRVKNINSNKLIHCRVDAPGIVSVEF
ncbi:MAG: flagellar basal body P-ring formation protein FlgA [Desulfobulbaceae bacterium]|nr:flagellar basal body P-ring formation protein FlgA [Desulfobulbaceae bacterium]